MTELSNRLQAVANMVTPGYRLADVGTDHGYVPIYLIETGKIPSAVAMDINEGPLKRAKDHICEKQLEDKITVRLSDGLKGLKTGEADTMIAAGMGGGLVIRILSEGEGECKGVKEYILQPQSEIRKVREYLQEEGYRTIAEDMVFEDGKFYPMMKVEKGTVESSGEEELEYGRLLLKEAHPVLKSFLEKEQETSERLIEELKNQYSLRAEERITQLRHKLITVKAVLEQYF